MRLFTVIPVGIVCLTAWFWLTGCARKPRTETAIQASAGTGTSKRAGRKTQGNEARIVPAGRETAAGAQVTYDRAKVNGQFISITFDDGPQPTNTPRLLDMLQARNIKATFFVIGNQAARFPAVIRRIAADGHELANHTWTHGTLSRMTDSGVRNELRRAHAAIADLTGSAPTMYRPPGGSATSRQRKWILQEFGYPTIMWTVDPRDWERIEQGGTKGRPDLLCERILNDTKAGSIVLVHDLHASSVDAMPATLDGLLARGFRFLTMSQLLEMNHRLTTPAPDEVAAQFSPGSF